MPTRRRSRRGSLVAYLVSPEREGQTIRYRLEISAVEEAMAFLMDIAGTGQGEAALPHAAQPCAAKAPRR